LMLSLVIYDQGKESIKDHLFFSPRSHEKQKVTLAPFKQRGCGVVYCRLSTTATLSTTPTLSTTTTPAPHLPHPEGPELSTTPHPLAPLPMMIDVGAREIRCGHAAPPSGGRRPLRLTGVRVQRWVRQRGPGHLPHLACGPVRCRVRVVRGCGAWSTHATHGSAHGSIPRGLLARIATPTDGD
jgi:hypothetical protein